MTDRCCKRVLIVVLPVVLLAVSYGIAAAKRESHQFTLLKRRGMDPYTLLFPFTVTKPGLVRVYVKVHNFKSKPVVTGKLVKIFADRRRPRPLVGSSLKPGKQGFQLRYAVDSVELTAGKEYQLVLSNLSGKRRAIGELLIDYPQEGEPDQGARPVYPDLAVTGIQLDRECRLRVSLANQGKGRLAASYWQRNIPELKIQINGRRWGGASLKGLDPGHKLGPPGGQVVYTSRAVIQGAATVTAELRFPGPSPDNNRANDSLSRQLRCDRGGSGATAQRPDLAVKSIRVVAGCRVAVEIVNRGPGELPAAAWQQGTSPLLMLFRNGRSWGGAELRVLDRRRQLRRPGGRVVYTSRLRVQGRERIRAMVDSLQVLVEQNKANNSLEQELACGR